MDNLTKSGLEFINGNKDLLLAFVERVLPQIKANPSAYGGEDVWFLMNRQGQVATYTESEKDLVDLNIWRDDESGKWAASAYPMEINSVGTVQTNTQDFVRIFSETGK